MGRLFGKRRGKNAVFVVCGYRLALSAVSSMSTPDSVAPVTAGEIIFALRKKGKKKALVRGLVRIIFLKMV